MGPIEILMYSTGSVFFLSALAFTYYAIKNSRLMRGPLGHQLMAAGAVFFMVALIVGTVDHFFFPGSGLIYAAFFIWIAGLSHLVGGGWRRAKDIQQTYRVSLFRILTMMPHSKLYLAIVALVFITLPIFGWTVLGPLRPEFVWLDVIKMVVWAFAFASLAVGERIFYRSLRPPIRVDRVERRLLRSDIRTLMARLDLTNSYLMSAAMIAGMKPLEMHMSRCAEENPAMLEGYELELLGKLRAEPLVKNLDRIDSRERDQAIFKAFCCIDARVVTFYAGMTSPEYATRMVNRSFEEVVKLHCGLIYDYALPALLSGNVLEHLLMKCKKGTREALGEKIRALGKDYPLIRTLEIEHDGRVNITEFYQALAPMSQSERIKRTISSFSAILRSSYPVIHSDLGEARTKEIVAGALSDLLKRSLVRWADIRELSEEFGLKLARPKSD
jgi:hypothetical protein